VSSESVPRRDAIRTLAGLAATASGLTAVGCSPRTSPPPQPGTPVAPLIELPEGATYRVIYRDQPVLLIREGRSVRALSGLCTHESCELGWNSDQRLIRCPCHGSAFDPAGKVVKGPATEPLPVFEAVVRDGTVFLVG